MASERRNEPLIVGFRRLWTPEHDDIDGRQIGPSGAKAFTDDPLEAVTVHRASRTLFRHRKPEPRPANGIGARQDGEATVYGSDRLRKDRPVVTRRPEAQLWWESRAVQLAPLAQGVRRARPLRRRDARTLRPLRVDIRARKPWVRARLMRLGWKVLFMVKIPVEAGCANCRGTKTADYRFQP